MEVHRSESLPFESVEEMIVMRIRAFLDGVLGRRKVNIQNLNFIMRSKTIAEITSILDQDVYTQKGIFVGRVDDAVLDPEKGVISGLALGDVNRDLFDLKSKGIVIPFRWVTAVGDIVIIRHLSRNAKAERKDG